MLHTPLKNKNCLYFCFIFLFTTHLTVARETNPIKTKAKNENVFKSQFENILGTSFEMKVKTSSSKQAMNAEKIALKEINRLSKILSAYDQNSEFSAWMRTQNKPVKVSKELLEVLSLFDTWKHNTKGALDPAAEVVSKV